VAAALLGFTLAREAAAPLGALFAGLSLAAYVASRLPLKWLGPALTVLLSAVMLATVASAFLMGSSLATSTLAVSGLVVCVLCAAVGWRSGSFLALLSAASVCTLAMGVAGNQPLPLLQLGSELIAIVAGLAAGLAVSRLLTRQMRSAFEGEQRLRSLLALAADAHWEIDQQYRLVAAASRSGEMRPLTPEEGRGTVPWELPQFICDADVLDALQADLDTRSPFRDLPVGWSDGQHGERDFRISGEPRFDESGVFVGYRGVARDVTDLQATQQALAATETRYHELFSRIPTPLVLHRGGRVIDANPAAAALFGHGDLRALIGTDLLAGFESGDSRERARRTIETLHGQPLGTAVPVSEFRLLVEGRRTPVSSTSVRVDAKGGPALLAIFVDETDRLASEAAVRHSEAMLSHLVATSPDLITLTDLATGRYAMVNHAFERISGWSAQEAVGRTALELGVWGKDSARDEFVQHVRDVGAVNHVPVRFVTKRGVTAALIVSAARFVMDRRDYMVINARDVSEKERERLEREAILANASIGIAVTRRRRFVLANRHFEHIYGWAPGELLGQPGVAVWGSAEDYADVARVAGEALSRGDPIEMERAGRRKDGSTFLARIRGRAVDPEQPADNGTVWIVEDVTERRQAEQALARARDEAESANRAKSAFLANTSHELRTPLNGMIGMARLARSPDLAEPLRRQYLDQIAESAQALAGIISDILDLSKIEAGKLQIETATFDLAAELRRLQGSYAVLAAAHGLNLWLEIGPDIEGGVRGDPLRLRQIASNYLGNALKFTETGSVGLKAFRLGPANPQTVRLEVHDTGPGIDAATRERLFKPFTQADQSTTRRFGGTGLGLSICRELATLMDGTVGVDSGQGAGSIFWAEVPLPPATLGPGHPRPDADGDRALAGRRVLMAEDNPVNMLIATAMLERWGVEVVQAEDGRQAVAAVQQAQAEGRPFDAVLMDVQMPVMSGHEATRLLRQMQRDGRLGGVGALPIIALTAAALVSEREEALGAGMNDFLTKPIDAERLHASLLRWCTASV
jgi:PAS domain S-box-containing protein